MERIWMSDLPESSSSWGVYFPLIGRHQNGESSVQKQVKQANLLNPSLISTPDTKNRFLPPCAVPGKLGEASRRKIISDRKLMKKIALIYLFLITVVLWLAADLKLALTWFTINSVICLYLHIDNKALFQTSDRLIERAMFYSWIYWRGRSYFYSAVLLLTVIGSTQLILISLLGSNDLVLETFGLHYIRVTENNQWWRIVTGPFFHASLAHWLSNLALAIGLFTLCGPMMQAKRFSVVILLCAIGSFLAVYFVHLLLPLNTDGLIGLSGGLGGLMGWIITVNLRRPKLFPEKFYFTLFYFASITLVVMPLFLNLTTLSCHVSGMILGGLMALLMKKEKFDYMQSPKHSGQL